MAYVKRDGSNNIVGVFKRLQPGVATEIVAESVQELIDFRNRPEPVALSNSKVFDNTKMPVASSRSPGDHFWHSGDKKVYYSDGTDWFDSMGTKKA